MISSTELTSPLLSLPPEILHQILSELPLRALLAFSLTSHASHAFASCALSTLSYGIYPTRLSSLISRLASPPHPFPTKVHSLFGVFSPPSNGNADLDASTASLSTSISTLSTASSGNSSILALLTRTELPLPSESGHCISHVLPSFASLGVLPEAEGHQYRRHRQRRTRSPNPGSSSSSNSSSSSSSSSSPDRSRESGSWAAYNSPFPPSLLNKLHASLHASVVGRYAHSLRQLDLRLWTLDEPIARALARCAGLRVLSLKLGECRVGRRDGEAERRAWKMLVREAEWWRLGGLRVVGAGKGFDEEVLGVLLRGRRVRELWIGGCEDIGWKDVLAVLSRLGRESAYMKVLSVWGEEGREVDAEDQDENDVKARVKSAIAALRSLEFLSFRGCKNLEPEDVDRWNREVWHIREIALPTDPDSLGAPDVIEVDPAYL